MADSAPDVATRPRPLNLAEYERLARARAAPEVWDYIAGGSDDEVTLGWNTAAFRRLALRPRVLAGATDCDITCDALGVRLRSPLMVAPLGYQRLVHPEGERATARAAGAEGALMVVSTMSTCSLEEVAAVATAPLWFQLYLMRDLGLTEALVRRAEEAGYRALVVTVDAPLLGRRERDLRNGFAFPADLQAANLPVQTASVLGLREHGTSAPARHAALEFDGAATWDAIGWLRAKTCLPIVLKGILTAEDARRAAACGCSGIIVSNHGGRQLDGVAASIDALAEVAGAVGGSMELFLDGGVRRGTDVLKARALGARAVLVGRPVMWGLLVGGEQGVADVLGLLRAELLLAMTLAGRASWDAVDRSLIQGP
ncbi:alpha-hydroxy acid oxidase [Sorangium sp. So ce1097]|uniref:alpha-hydroxy acid oxidase n=1 Tax=Sorangium sp. So ce1097 TaxID=3133330 RepID=UPI003F60B17A